MATAEYDRAADALYIRLGDGPVARTVEADDYRILDIDEAGAVIGLEVLYPAENLVIAPLAREFGFDDELEEIDRAVAEALPAPVATTVTTAIVSLQPQLFTEAVDFAAVSIGTSAAYTTPAERVLA